MTELEIAALVDPYDARRVHGAAGLLGAFNEAGVLSAADVHVARRLGELIGEATEAALLALALAVRAPRLGHIYVDLATIAMTATVESDVPVDLTQLDWPDAASWVATVASSSLTTNGEAPADEPRPLRLVGNHLYLDRYWREEVQLAADLVAFSSAPAVGVDVALLSTGVARLFANDAHDGRQAAAAATAVLRRLTVVAGGPGTGKTTTVAGIVALLLEQSADRSPPLIALAAPTGKAAARLQEAVHANVAELDTGDDVRAAMLELDTSTLHRLLGWRPRSHSRFRHDRTNRLPHDVVIVDESSMVSLSLMGRLVEAVRPDARLILVGDPDQLTSVEAGAVLGDVVGPAADAPIMRPAARAALETVTGHTLGGGSPSDDVKVGDGIVVLERVHRFGGTIAALARAVRDADADAVVACLANGSADVTWLATDVADAAMTDLEPIRTAAVDAGTRVVSAAKRGDAFAALGALGSFRVLCAHRRGPHGAARWMTRVERWLDDAVLDFDPSAGWYVGRPLLVTENDYSLKLYNGDTGVVVAKEGTGSVAAFERRGEVFEFSPTRLSAVDTVYAMTIHKSQGSQFQTAAVLLPTADSPILSRELLYTAVTRASKHLIVAGTEEAIRGAVARPAARASGLRGRLWGEGGGPSR